MMIYEVRDYCTALLDTEGALISQNIGGVSHFVADLGVVIKDAVDRYGLDGFLPGRCDPAQPSGHRRPASQQHGGLHARVLSQDGWSLSPWCAPIGSMWADYPPASAAPALMIPGARGCSSTRSRSTKRACRTIRSCSSSATTFAIPEAAMGDMRSQLAACHLGERRSVELLDRYGRTPSATAIATIFVGNRSEVPRGRSSRHSRWRLRSEDLHGRASRRSRLTTFTPRSPSPAAT